MMYIGIDPGVSGGIAVLDARPGKVIATYKMPETPADLLDLLKEYDPRVLGEPVRAMLERVNAGVFGQGKAGRMGVTSAFTFGRGVGYLQMALLAAYIPTDEVSPVKWQNALGCRTGGDKNVSKARAQQLFSTIKITHATADALLLAEYGRRFYSGDQAATTNGGSDGKKEQDQTAEQTERQAKGARRGQGSTQGGRGI